MKRSEAIEKIVNKFFRPTQNYAKQEAEVMLNFFEKELGMRPPVLAIYEDPKVWESFTGYVNMWEDE